MRTNKSKLNRDCKSSNLTYKFSVIFIFLHLNENKEKGMINKKFFMWQLTSCRACTQCLNITFTN